jgi:CSLREA domain-containing protein
MDRPAQGRRTFRPLYALLGFLALTCVLPASAGAITVTVNTVADDFADNGLCSLREAVTSTNTDVAFNGCPAGTGDDVITLPQGTYDLTRAGDDNTNTNGDLDFLEPAPDSLSVVGTGRVVIRSGVTDRVIDHVVAGDLNVSNVTISGGNPLGAEDGGGILNRTGDLTVQGVTLRGNSAGIDGGGVANYATASLRNVTVSGNTTGNDGGGIYVAGGSSTSMLNVTIAFNTANADGGPGGDGGGIAGSGNLSSFNTIIGNNLDASPVDADKAPDCATGPGFFPRYTLIEAFDPATCLVGFNPGTNIVGQDPLLAGLALNGGTTPTRALREGSPAIDAGGTTAPDECLTTDQRGVTRPQRGGCDLGAYEALPAVRCGGRMATLVGTPVRNVLRGTPGRDVIAGLGGPDRIRGLGGNDLICGGRGNDTLIGDAGNDTLLGQAGADRLTGGGGRDLLRGGPGRDRLSGGVNRDRLFGGAGPDRLVGGPAQDRLRGGPGHDSVLR